MTCSACRSIWICVSTGLFGSAALPAIAQEAALAVRPADRERFSSEPRQVVSTSFLVRNLSADSIDVESQVVLPSRWRTLTPAFSHFDLGERESKSIFTSFMIPEDAKAGDYRVSFTARDRHRPAISDTYEVQVHVTASMRVTATILDTPDFASAGESVGGAILFRNVGNAPVAVKFKVTSRFLADVRPDQGEVDLDVGESRRVDLVITAGRVRENVNARLMVSTEIAESERTEASSSIRIVPESGMFDSMRTVDSRFEARYAARDAPGGRNSGWQPALAGGGILDENRKDLLRFLLRGPDGRENGTFGAPEEYWVRYDSQRFMAGAGDLDYGLSPLTEPGRLGRGAQVEFHDGRWGATAYAMRDSFGEGNNDQLALGSHVRFASDAMLGFNYLNRTTAAGRGNILTLRALNAGQSNFNLDLELARSVEGDASGGAIRFAIRDDRHAVRYYALGWSADPEFIGPLRDKVYLSTGFDFPNASGWGFRGYYRLQDWNLVPLETIDPDLRDREPESDRMQSTPKERQASVGVSHPVGAGASISLDLVARDRDGSPSTGRDADLESASWRAGINRAWANVSLAYSIEQGESHYKATGKVIGTSSQMFSASLRAGQAQHYSLYLLRDDNSDVIERDPRRESAGITANYVAGDFSLNLDAQVNRSRFGRSAVYDVSLLRQAESGSRFRLSARRLEGRFARTDYLLSYSVPFAMPVARRSDLVTVRGRVFDAETLSGVKGAVLRLDGTTVATNSRGEFRIPAIRRGSHSFGIERGATDVRQVPANAIAPEIVVSGSNSPPILIAMVRSAAIDVRISVKPHPGEESPEIAGLLVHFRRGETVYRRLTDGGGRARLGGIPPGKWLVSIAGDTLPAGYLPGSEELELSLEAGETATADIVLTPEHREIRMQAPLAVR